MLDKRNLKTPSGTRLVIPKNKKVMALLIAHEWQIQDEVLKQHALPMVGGTGRLRSGHGFGRWPRVTPADDRRLWRRARWTA